MLALYGFDAMTLYLSEMGRAKRQGAQKSKVDIQRATRSDGEVRRWYLWATFVAVVSILVMLTWSIVLFSRSSTDENLKPIKQPTSGYKVYGAPGKVDTRVLSSPSASFSRKCIQGGVPVLLKNTVVGRWQAKKWSPSYLQSKLGTLQGIYENDNRWFGPYFDRTKPLLDHVIRRNPYKTNIKLSADEFFQRLNRPLNNRYHYFSGDIEQLGDWAYSEIQPIEELLLPNPSRSSANAWIGQPHVIAHCHYDGYHNFYAQLYGTKMFTLFRPTNWPGLYPYPFLHPSHAQAQVNASDNGDVERFGMITRVEAVEVTLAPGDLLYIPPLWFHEVESLSVSISVNVWTDSQQTELAERIFSLSLPLGYDHKSPHKHEHAQWHDAREQRIAAAILMFRLLEQVCKHHVCVDSSTDRFYEHINAPKLKDTHNPQVYFIHQLWSTRYRHLMEGGELPSSFYDGEYILCESGNSKDTQVAVLASEAMVRDVHYGAYFEQVSQLVRGLPTDTWQLWVGNYVEYVAASVLGEVKHVGLFLKHFNSCTRMLK